MRNSTPSFYLYFLPFFIGIILLSIPSFYLNIIKQPKIDDAITNCTNISNEDVYATKYGTLQDQCIAFFMGEPRDWEILLQIVGLLSILTLFPIIFFKIILNLKMK